VTPHQRKERKKEIRNRLLSIIIVEVIMPGFRERKEDYDEKNEKINFTILKKTPELMMMERKFNNNCLKKLCKKRIKKKKCSFRSLLEKKNQEKNKRE
jgi:hypothetical protein